MSNIKRFPGSVERRERREKVAGKVVCQVSQRWLQFPESYQIVGEKSFMFVDVMTLDSNEQPRKLCEMVLTKEDLRAMLDRVNTEFIPTTESPAE